MNYWTDLFSPETYDAFGASDRAVSGFRATQQSMADRVQPGDKLLCYVVRLMRWAGVLEVVDGPFTDATPIFYPEADPFTVRFHVKPLVWLPLELSIPIHQPEVFSQLSFTRNATPGKYWQGPLRRSLQRVEEDDGKLLESLLKQQEITKKKHPIDDELYAKAIKRKVQRPEGAVAVTVPDDVPDDCEEPKPSVVTSESFRVQADLCRLGEAMGLKIWVPVADRSRVLEHWKPQPSALLERLPLNYDHTTLDTIERIDVLWLKGRTIRRAFEVEHTTAIYSGLLRMADLCALLPNINVALHIVAPEHRRDKVFQEIKRPVFSLLEHSPLFERCTYLSYGSVQEMKELEYLAHTTDSVLDEFVEHANEGD